MGNLLSVTSGCRYLGRARKEKRDEVDRGDERDFISSVKISTNTESAQQLPLAQS